MMPPSEEGFYERKGGRTSYISVLGTVDDKGRVNAVFAESVNEGDKGAVSRINKNKKMVWERHHSAFGANIKAVYVKEDKEYGNQLCIRTKTKTLQVPMNSPHATKFIAVCHNIDLNQMVLFEPYKMPKKDENKKPVLDAKGQQKFITGWTIKQGGEEKENKLEDALDMSKEGPVPAFKKLKNGKWDTSDRDEYLETYLKEWIEENDLNKKPESVTESDDEDSGEDEDDEDNDSDDDEDDDEDDDPEPPKKANKKFKKGTDKMPF